MPLNLWFCVLVAFKMNSAFEFMKCTVMPWQLHGDGGYIGGQLSIGPIQSALQYGLHHHGTLLKK